MKLNLLFIVMDFLISLAYPFVFVYGKLRQFSKSRETINPTNSITTGSITSGQ